MGLRRGNWLMAADAFDAPAAEEKSLDVSDLTVKEIEEKVESGELSADEVYEAEKAGKARKSVLEAYAPAKDEEDEGTTGEG